MKKMLLLIIALTMLLLSFGTIMAVPQKAVVVKKNDKLSSLWLPKGIDADKQKQIEQKIMSAIGNDVSIHWDSDTIVRKVQMRSLSYPK